MDLLVRPAEPDDPCVPLLYESAKPYYIAYAGSERRALALLDAVCPLPDHAASYDCCTVAFVDGELVGGGVGFLATGARLHSHVVCVRPGLEHHGLGYAVKQHQRAWALQERLPRVVWTFDPLVRRNAYFNLQKLGARAAAYFENFYGSMTDGVNAGDESDRLLIEWELSSPRVDVAAEGPADEPNFEELVRKGATVALSIDENGRPKTGRASGPIVLCATPESIVGLRREAMDIALDWRRALRNTLGAAMSDGYTIQGFTRSGSYVLLRDG
jgi:predicted GNAT superfamily acetyltransferase